MVAGGSEQGGHRQGMARRGAEATDCREATVGERGEFPAVLTSRQRESTASAGGRGARLRLSTRFPQTPRDATRRADAHPTRHPPTQPCPASPHSSCRSIFDPISPAAKPHLQPPRYRLLTLPIRAPSPSHPCALNSISHPLCFGHPPARPHLHLSAGHWRETPRAHVHHQTERPAKGGKRS
jgi:hypothetical protein